MKSKSLAEQHSPQGVFVSDHAGLVIDKLSLALKEGSLGPGSVQPTPVEVVQGYLAQMYLAHKKLPPLGITLGLRHSPDAGS